MAVLDQLEGTLDHMNLYVWLWQLKKQLNLGGDLHTVDAAVSADITNDVRLLWDNLSRSYYGDALSDFIQQTLGKSDAYMQALYQSAANQAEPGSSGSGSASSDTCQIWQVKYGLVNAGVYSTVEAAISPDTSAYANIIWTNGGETVFGDDISDIIQTATGWSDDLMISYYNSWSSYVR